MTKSISVKLAVNVVYVSGIVNGKDYTFTLQSTDGEATTWTAMVDRATPDVYHCKITAIDSLGVTATIETTLYFGLNLITDRTQMDVDYAQSLNDRGFDDWTTSEVAEYLAGLKGAYNAADLNRVESAVAYVLSRFVANGYDEINLQIKNTWILTDFMSTAETQRYLQNIRDLRAQFTMPSETPEVPTDMDNFTYAEANDIERILEIIDEYITKIEQTFTYSGELYGGEI